MEVSADMLNTILPMDEPVLTEITPSREVAVHPKMRISYKILTRNMRMNIIEVLQEALFSMVQSTTRRKSLVAAN
jgi:hypothetical protein